jgi:hypothetical protein
VTMILSTATKQPRRTPITQIQVFAETRSEGSERRFLAAISGFTVVVAKGVLLIS